jgi:hypothetical protein
LSPRWSEGNCWAIVCPLIPMSSSNDLFFQCTKTWVTVSPPLNMFMRAKTANGSQTE